MAKAKGKTINNLTEVEKAYLAAFIDGEGCITISRKKSCDGTKGGIQYRLYVCVTNTNEKVINWLNSVTGLGNISERVGKKANHKKAFVWGLWSIQAKQFLEQIKPYMIIKNEQAEIAIDFINRKRDGVGRAGLSSEEWNRQFETHAKMTVLNKRGTL